MAAGARIRVRRLSWTSGFHAGRRDGNPDGAALRDRALQGARRAQFVDQRIDRRERRRPLLRHDDILRHVEQVVRQQPRAGCRRRERGQALAAGAERVDAARGQRLAQLGRIVLELHERCLLENAFHAQRDRIVDRPGDLLSRAVDIGDRLDGRAVEHEKALPHQHVGLGELHRPEPRRLIGDKANVGRSALDRLDDGRRSGDRLELERHIVAAGQFAGEIIGYSAHLAGRRIAHRLRRVGAEIGRAQRAARCNLAGHRGGTARKCGGNHHQAERSHRIAPSTIALARPRASSSCATIREATDTIGRAGNEPCNSNDNIEDRRLCGWTDRLTYSP
jgi:hypothetical protein